VVFALLLSEKCVQEECVLLCEAFLGEHFYPQIDPSVCRYLLSVNVGAIARTRVTGSTLAVSTNPCALTVTFYPLQAASSRYQTLSNVRSSPTRSCPFRSAPRCTPR
jgi:hypothetical protein